MKKAIGLVLVLVCLVGIVWMFIVSDLAVSNRSVDGIHSAQEKAQVQGASTLIPDVSSRDVEPSDDWTNIVFSSSGEAESKASDIGEQIRQISAKDISDEINAEVRHREEHLQVLSLELSEGISDDQVSEIMGIPDVTEWVAVKSNSQGDNSISWHQVKSGEKAPTGFWVSTSYWPRVGVPFDGRNGQGYRVLRLLFNKEHRLEQWFWQQPVPWYTGSVGSVVAEQQYWTGKHEVSKAPPVGAHWHY